MGQRMQAIWNGEVLAESDDTVVVEGNHYFPPSSIKPEFFEAASWGTVCPWKGTASYYSVEVGGEINENAAWFYPEPSEAAAEIRNRVAFWKGVKVQPA